MRHRSGPADPGAALRRHADYRTLHRRRHRRPAGRPEDHAIAESWGMTAANRLLGGWQALSQATGLDRLTGDRPPGAAGELGRLLWTDPRPLIHTRKRMIVVFSPKSACTSAVIWFFHQLGHAKAARDYASWPHRYRSEVYYKSRVYRLAFERDLSKFSLVRII